MTTKKSKLLSLTALMVAFGAFLGASKADVIGDVAEKLGQLVHNPAQCPRLGEGYYNADNSTESKFIEVYDNKDMKRLELNLNGYEFIPVNGKDTPQKNGFRLTGACVDNTVRIVGKDASGGLSDTTIKPANDGGLQVEQNTPKVPALHYTAAGGLRTPMDRIRKWFMPESTQKQGTGLPQQGGQQPQ